MADLVGQTIDQYRFERLIGQGGMGSVYQARDLSLQRDVAIKVIHPQLAEQPAFRKQFLDRIQQIAALNHPNIAAIYERDYVDGQLYMVAEYISGGNLATYLQEGREIRLNEAVELAAQSGDALHYAHQQGILHTALKPTNILLKTSSAGQQAVLTDFGLTELVEMPPDSAAQPYLSPEQALDQTIDGRSDIYALGSILLEMVTGLPYQPNLQTDAGQPEELMLPTSVRGDLPAELQRILLKALSKDLSARYQTAGEFARELRLFLLERSRREAAEYKVLPRVEETIADEDEQDQETPVPPPPVSPRTPPPPPMRAPTPIETIPPPISLSQLTFDKLVIRQEKRPVQVITLNKNLFVLGRDEDDCDIILDHHRVSREHARIEITPEGTYLITDLSSTNGTWLGNNRLPPNVETLWPRGEIVRIGDLYLTIEQEEELEETMPLIPIVPINGNAPPIRPQSPNGIGETRIDALLIPTAIAIEPGGAGNLMLDIINIGAQTEHFVVTASDISPNWITVPAHSVHLEAGASATVPIVLHPPRGSSSIAGIHPFTLKIASLNRPDKFTVVQGQIQITGFHEFGVELQPAQVRSGRRADLVIRNLGNMPASYSVTVPPFQSGLTFELPAGAVPIEPNQSVKLRIRVFSRNRPFIGSERVVPFEITVTSDQGGVLQQYGAVAARPTISFLTIFLLFLLLLGGLGALGFFGFQELQRQQQVVAFQNATATEVLSLELTDVQLTAVQLTLEAADEDGDTLNTVQEEEFGTDPENPDTDGDGLADNVEVLQLKTDPLNPDTDGDGLSDSDEVNRLKTDPLNPDTDEDGIPDGEDSMPLRALNIANPDDFVIFYYSEINRRNYDVTYPLITGQFRYSNGTYTPELYAAWWDKVEEIIIGDVHTLTADENYACVRAELTYNMTDGTTLIDDTTTIYMIRDFTRDTWLINLKIAEFVPAFCPAATGLG